jgi:hypothetical protein
MFACFGKRGGSSCPHAVPLAVWCRFAESARFLTVLAFVSVNGRAFAQEAKPRPITPRGELSAEEKGTIDLFQRARCRHEPGSVYRTTGLCDRKPVLVSTGL